MKIAYITTGNIYMNSSANIRNIALIKGLEELGHSVNVVCFENNKKHDAGFIKALNDSNVYCVGKNAALDKLTEENATVSYVTTPGGIRKNLKKTLNKLYRHVQVYDPYKHKIGELDSRYFRWEDFDICITSSDPKSSHLLAYEAKKKGYRFKWVQYWGDPMTLDLTSNTWVKPIIRKEEKKLFTVADLIVFTNNPSVQAMRKCYPNLCQKFISIPTSSFKTARTSAEKKVLSDRLSIGYYGGCSKVNRNIIPLINVVKNDDNLELTLAGGNDEGLVTGGNLTVYDRVSSDKIDELTEHTDILVVLENFPENRDWNEPCRQIPGKMYHYAMLKKPILVICETDSLKKEFEQYDVYTFCKNEEQEIQKAVENIKKEIDYRTYEIVNDFLPTSSAKKLMSCLE